MRYRLLPKLLCAALSSVAAAHSQLPRGSSFGVAGENAAYDYVIVGGGTAGLTVATRLAQDGRYSVAVLEAGGFPDIENGNHSSVPGYSFAGLAAASLDGVNPKVDWMDMTTIQVGGRPMHYAQGKGIGGSSFRNLMVYQRPTVGSMQKWADETGDQSWTWHSVLPYFQKSTTLTAPKSSARGHANDPSYDETAFGKGPLRVGFANYVAPFAAQAKKAFEELGQQALPNGIDSGQLIGHSYITLSIDSETQQRSSAQTSYLNLALEQTQLVVYTGALAKKILFDTDKRAVGVSVETSGVRYNITAKREVILSAGALRSPQLLMISGIGDKKQLAHHNIAIISHRPGVGKNLQDNPLFGLTFAVDIESATTYMFDPQRFGKAIQDYNEHRTGFLTSSSADMATFLKAETFLNANFSDRAKVDLAAFPADWPDVQLFASSFWLGPGLGSMPPDFRSYATFVGGLLTPLSRGTVDIRSADTSEPPIVDAGWLTHPTDQEVAVNAIRHSRSFLQTKAIKSIMLDDEEAYPGADVTSHDDLLDIIKKQTGPFYHASATCKMGLESDEMAVVDSKHRVFGVEGLRVVDMSAVPFLPPGQPQSVAYMLAEKAADEILLGAVGAAGAKAGHDEL